MTEFVKGLLIAAASGSVIAGILFLIKPLMERTASSRSRYFAWYLVFIRFLIPFTLGISLFGTLIPAETMNIEGSTQLPVTSAASSQAASAAVSHTVAPATGSASVMIAGIEKTTDYGNLLIQSIWPVLFAVWIIGMILLLSVHIIGYLQFDRQIKATRKCVCDRSILETLESCRVKTGVKGNISLYCSYCTDTPILVGIMRPCIIIPDAVLTGEELRNAFLHELVHCRRHDNVLKWLTVISLCVQWFNPVAYLAFREINRQCELSCDDAATAGFSREEKVGYGRTLLAAASQNRPYRFTISSGMGENKRNLKERLEALMKIRKLNRKTAFISVSVLVAVALLTVSSVLVFGGTKALAANKSADISAHTNVDVSGLGSTIEQSSPVQLPAAAKYPKPMFDGTVTQVSPAWDTPSVIPDNYMHIDPDNAQSLPVKDFTITQCWEGKVQGNAFILQTYCNFDLSGKGQSGGEECYVALKTGNKVYVTSVDKFETLVNFCGPMVIFIRNSMSYDVLAIDLRNGNEVEASSDAMYSLACAQPFDLGHSPIIPSHVMGISKQIATYPVSQISASVSNPFNNQENSALWAEAWGHRIGRQ
jgi:beta-lactamase regulating signal transducer with metallopeptidase domain